MLNRDSISNIAGACGRPCEIRFAKMGIFQRIQVLFGGNDFFQPLAPLSVHVGSHPPWGRSTQTTVEMAAQP